MGGPGDEVADQQAAQHWDAQLCRGVAEDEVRHHQADEQVSEDHSEDGGDCGAADQLFSVFTGSTGATKESQPQFSTFILPGMSILCLTYNGDHNNGCCLSY